MLAPGQPAPEFELPDADMQTVDLSAFKGKKNVVLYFYPKDGTPGCTIVTTDFSDHEEQFGKHDCVVLGVSRDDCLTHADFRDRNGVTIGLLSDTDGTESKFESVDALPFKPRDLAELIQLLRGGRVSQSAGQKILTAMLSSSKSPLELARELGLEQVDDAASIERWCRDALAGKESAIADVRAGKHKALGALIGPVMAASGGRANPARVRETLLRIIMAENPPGH